MDLGKNETTNSRFESANSNDDFIYGENGSEENTSGSRSISPCSSGSSGSYIEAEWANFTEENGSLTYVESYVSSTVKERQVVTQAIKASENEKKSLFPLPSRNIKRQTKLMGLLKRRPSVRARPSSGVCDTTGTQESTSPKVTFRDTLSGEIRYVALNVTDVGTNFGRRATLCESVLRIMPGRFSEPPDSRIMVAGLSPGSQALREGLIKIGDWLKELNGIELDWDNLDTVLMGVVVPSVVTVAVQKCAEETLSPEDHRQLKKVTQTRFVKFVTGKEERILAWESMVKKSSLPLHVVLHLSLRDLGENSKEGADIRYQFPSTSNQLIDVRGMFITLCHSLQQILGSSVISSTVTLHGVHYHCAFSREQEDVFMIILPHFCLSEADLVNLMEQLEKIILFQFGSLAKCFCNPTNKDYLDHLFLLTMENILTLEDKYGETGNSTGEDSPIFHGLYSQTDYAMSKARAFFGSPSTLVLADEFAKIQLEICLNELQSGEFGDGESECEDCLLLYNIVGCCLFYKSHLILSHLDSVTTELVSLFAEYHRFLCLVEKEALSQMVVWRRVFIPRQNGTGDHAHESHGGVDHYLLLVAMNNLLLATLVESGNVTKLMDRDAGPDPLLVDQVETTLYHLHSLHVHTICEENLLSHSFETVSIDDKVSKSSPSKKIIKKKSNQEAEGSTHTRLPDVPSILKQRSSPATFQSVEAPPLCDCDPPTGAGEIEDSSLFSDGEYTKEDEESCSSKDETSSDSDWKIGKGSEFKISPVHPMEGPHIPTPGTVPPLRVTAGEKCVLMHMVHLDVGEGMIVTSSPPGDAIGPLQAQLMRNFYAAVSQIRHVLLASKRNKNAKGPYIGSSVLNNVKEFGILFEMASSNKSKSRNVEYWIVGRMYGPPYEREIYVALEDSVAQNIQEIAFSVAFKAS